MSEPLVFSQTIEGLIRALGPRLDADTAGRLRAVGIDPQASLAPDYPREVWLQAIDIAALALCPDQPLESGRYELGKRFIQGYGTTLPGRSTTVLAGVLGPRKSLERMTQGFRRTDNHTQTRLVELGPGLFELWVSEVHTVEFIRGIIVAGLEVSGAVNPGAEIVSHDREGTTYRVHWD